MLTVNKYPESLHKLTQQFTQAARAFPQTHITLLASDLIEGAKQFDLQKARHMGVTEAYSKYGVVRDAANPPYFEHPNIVGVPHTDSPTGPLPPCEKWNHGRRATQTGAVYDLDGNGNPVNPYMNNGITGRGLHWMRGPNHCIDNGILEIVPDAAGTPVLYIVGITRKDDPLKRPAMSGGFAKFTKTAGGEYILDEEANLETRLEEFFEEMISDSVELLPAYAAQIEPIYKKQADRIINSRGAILTPEHAEELKEQVITGLKMQQVEDMDPDFLVRLKEFLRQGTECFAGPVLSSGRATINAWIESRLNWVMLDDQKWKQIVGKGPFDYKLSGGDDSGGVYRFRVGADTIKNAVASHGPMMTFMLASYILDAQKNKQPIHPAIMKQIEDVADFLRTPVPDSFFTARRPEPG